MLTHIAKYLDRLFFGEFLACVGQFLSAELFHAFFDFKQVFIAESLLSIEVVIKALLDGGANRHLHIRPELFNRLSHEMRGAVPIYFTSGIGIKSMYHQIAIFSDHGIYINEF